MTKENVIKALQWCGLVGGCEQCPYNGMENCDTKMNIDAIELLKATEAPHPKYTRIEVYTKKGDLTRYFHSKNNAAMPLGYYVRERDIQLVAMFRWEGDKCFCKIKCPVNPMPTNDEFKAVSLSVVQNFLREHGWTFKQSFLPRMFM